MRVFYFTLRWMAALLLSSCTPVYAFSTATTEVYTPTPEVSATPTATVVWFPPTRTPAPPPTQPPVTPTPELRPGIGELIFSDDFSAPELWQLSKGTAGSVGMMGNELTIAISQPKVYLFSLRSQPALTDFYAEITAGPRLCHALDEYGLLVRVSSEQDFLRFSLSCDGQARLDRVVQGVASSPQPWLLSGAFMPGAPNLTRLGVWASGAEMRFFINGFYQFSLHDARFTGGALGVFARSASDNTLTVGFSELNVWEVRSEE